MDSRPTVFVVDDEPAIRAAVKWLVESAGFRVEAFANAGDFLAQYQPERAGCLVLDLRLPDMSGLDMARRLPPSGPRLPIILVTAHADVPIAVEAMKLGAVDVLEKPFDARALVDCVRRAVALDEQRRKDDQQVAELRQRLAALTPRERQVLDRVVKGLANKQIAAALGLSGKTVEIHRARVMQKMRADSLAELVRMTMQLDLPSAPSDGEAV